MAAHVRTQIRNAAVLALTGLATTGNRVFKSRSRTIAEMDLPCLVVTTGSEESRLTSYATDNTVDRLVLLSVTAYALATDDVDDLLDQIAKEIEVALAMPCAALKGLSNSIELISSLSDFDESVDRPKGMTRLGFEVRYFTQQSAPDVAL